MDKIRTFWSSPRAVLITLALAVLTFNNWLLAAVFNRPLLLKGGSVSEFGVPGQPYSWLFRSLDIVSGILFIMAGVLMVKIIAVKVARNRLLIIGTIILGASNTIDALLPLRCSEALDPSCSVPVHLSLSHFVIPSHGYSSVIIALCYLILPLSGLFYGLQSRIRTLVVLSMATLAAALMSFVAALSQYITGSQLSLHTWGVPQKLQMVLFGAWFIFWYLALVSHELSDDQAAEVPVAT